MALVFLIKKSGRGKLYGMRTGDKWKQQKE
jgi:hypothetical protein